MFLRDRTAPPSVLGLAPVGTAGPSTIPVTRESHVWSQPQVTRRAPGLSPRAWEAPKYEEPCDIPRRFFFATDQGFEVENASFFAHTKPPAARAYNEDTEWLTVFGFPQEAIASVRQYIEQKMNCSITVRTAEGNFMHVRMPTVESYHKCLALNGEMLFGNLVIGVMACRQTDMLEGTTAEQPLRTIVPTQKPNKWFVALLDFLFDV